MNQNQNFLVSFRRNGITKGAGRDAYYVQNEADAKEIVDFLNKSGDGNTYYAKPVPAVMVYTADQVKSIHNALMAVTAAKAGIVTPVVTPVPVVSVPQTDTAVPVKVESEQMEAYVMPD